MIRFQCIAIAFLLGTGLATANEIFVDNLNGRDSDDGSISVARQGNSGPVKTLERAGRLARFGDAIVLKNTGTPYYGSLSLMGDRHSGTRLRPFLIIGNGATISGLRSVPPEGWRQVKDTLWKFTATRKGYYQILRSGQLLPEFIPEGGLNPMDSLAAGHWASWRGSIYFRQDGTDTPDLQEFAFTADQTGISMHQVTNVLIVDVTLQHFRFDGIHAQGICSGIQLENVTCIENGHAGIVSSGASTIDIYGGTVERNGRYQILVNDRSNAVSHELVD